MKKKTVYIWMGSIVVFSVALFAAIYFFNLQHFIKPVVASVDRNGPPVFNHALYGDFENPLDKPMDAAKIGEFIYVSDTNNKQIQVFDQSGTTVFQFGADGSEEGQFKFPYGISGDKDGNVYVADLYNGNISIFDSKGVFLKYFENEVELQSPAGLRIYNDTLYVTDVKKNQVFLFNLEGEKLLEVGESGLEEGQFIAPNAVAIDKEEHIYVSDSGNNRIQIFDKDGKFVKIINGSIDGKGETIFLNPRGVAIDSQGTIYIVNSMGHKVYGFDKEGKEKFQFGEMGADNGEFYLPNGLFIDERDTLYITDTVNQRVAVFY